MIVLNQEELTMMKGGFSFWVGCAIVASIVFIVGVFDGVTRPIKCNK